MQLTDSQVSEVRRIAQQMSYRYRAIGYDRADLVQEGVLAVLKAVKTFKGEAPLEHFIRAVVQNRFLKINRDQKRRQVGGQKGNRGLESAIDPLPDAEGGAIEEEEMTAFRGAVKELPKQVRDVVELRMAGVRLDEIAKKLGLSGRPAAYRIEQEGLAVIREKLARRGLYS